MIKAPRKRGRPTLGPVVSVTIRLPVPQYDVLWKRATAARCSLSEYVRRVVTRRAAGINNS